MSEEFDPENLANNTDLYKDLFKSVVDKEAAKDKEMEDSFRAPMGVPDTNYATAEPTKKRQVWTPEHEAALIKRKNGEFYEEAGDPLAAFRARRGTGSGDWTKKDRDMAQSNRENGGEPVRDNRRGID
jgi:hypothetical protein